LIRKEKIQCRPLDDVAKEYAPDVRFHFLKIDAQGAEYQILNGAKTVLESCLELPNKSFTIV